MAEDIKNRINDSEVAEETETMFEKEARMIRNVFIMRSRILSMQIKVAEDKILTLESWEGIEDTTCITEYYRGKAEKAFSRENNAAADRNLLEAEQLYSEMAAKLFPAKPKKEEKPSEEYLRMKRSGTSSNRAGVTVRGNLEDVVACIDKAKIALADNNLEKAKSWLNKSQRIRNTENAIKLLAEVNAAIAARDAPEETPNIDPEAGPNVGHTNSFVDPYPEQARAGTPESPTDQFLHSENLEKVHKCIDNANVAFAANDLKKAKSWLNKSLRILYTENAQVLLAEVNAAIVARDAFEEAPIVEPEVGSNVDDTNFVVDPNLEQARIETPEPPTNQFIYNENIEGANKCVDNANKAFKAGDLAKAEIFLLKARRMYSSIDIEPYLKQLHDEKDKRNSASRKNPVADNASREPERPELTNNLNIADNAAREPERPELTNNLNKDESDTYIEIAHNAFKEEKYERALKFLDMSEKLYPSQNSKNLRKKVQDAMSKPKKSYVERLTDFIKEKPNVSYKDNIDNLAKAIQDDINTGNLEEAERKLRTSGFGNCVQLKRLRLEVNEKKAQRINKQQKPKPAKIKPQESICEEHRKEAETCIEVGEKAYYDGDLKKAKRLFMKAERIYPTDQAKNALEIVKISIEEKKKLDGEQPTCPVNERARAPVERTTEAIVNIEVEDLVNSGIDNMKKELFYQAKKDFEKAYAMHRSKSIEELLAQVQSVPGTSSFSTPKSFKETPRGIYNRLSEELKKDSTTTVLTPKPIEGMSTGIQNGQNEIPKSKDDLAADVEKHTVWAQNAFELGDYENAEFFLKLVEVIKSTNRSRMLLVNILKAKHGYETEESDDDDVNTFVVVEYNRKERLSKRIEATGKRYLKKAEDAFITDEYNAAKNLVTKSEVRRNPYVTELREKIENANKKYSSVFGKLLNKFFKK